MPKGNGRRNRRIRNLVIVSSFTAIVFIVATFAWFIGMRTVTVSSFDVEIASTDSLLLSLNGKDWDTTIEISEEDLGDVSYTGHKNSWGGRGLIPVSTIGEMDVAASRMKLYEKASLTPTPGGYRLLASRVPNTGDNEVEGYVAFDLFIKNFSGAQYLTALQPLDEEAIYLTIDSAVKVAEAGVKNTGIENSVRVAFAQIGRVSANTTDVNVITGITCNPDTVTGLPTYKNNVTGICRTAQIWEPNDTAHVANAISWYNTSCLARLNSGIASSSYSGECGEVADENTYPTYAVKDAIDSSDAVDVYDGAAYNGYDAGANSKLYAYPYFTDTMKDYTGVQRPQFITLAPNSITKVRIYIYIEGQDVDNYDFASIGKRIAVNFGFTKERLTEEDINYSGPSTIDTTDKVKPVITVLGNETETITKGSTYQDAGATAKDPGAGPEGADLDLTNKIRTVNPVDTTKAGVYTITYSVSDWAGNYAEQKTRTVTVTE